MCLESDICNQKFLPNICKYPMIFAYFQTIVITEKACQLWYEFPVIIVYSLSSQNVAIFYDLYLSVSWPFNNSRR